MLFIIACLQIRLSRLKNSSASKAGELQRRRAVIVLKDVNHKHRSIIRKHEGKNQPFGTTVESSEPLDQWGAVELAKQDYFFPGCKKQQLFLAYHYRVSSNSNMVHRIWWLPPNTAFLICFNQIGQQSNFLKLLVDIMYCDDGRVGSNSGMALDILKSVNNQYPDCICIAGISGHDEMSSYEQIVDAIPKPRSDTNENRSK